LPFWNRKTDVRLVVGLGNPGEKYARNRHNIGFMCLDYFAGKHDIPLIRSRSKAKVGEGRIHAHDVVISKPQTFMNNSGEAVADLVRRHKVKLENLIVVHDDMDLPVGRIRIRSGGSSGGHRGIKSIIDYLSNEDFIRVRVGIGRPTGHPSNDEDDVVISYVLGDFNINEKKVMDAIVPLVSDAIESLLLEGLTAAMNKFNATDMKKTQ